MTPTRQTPRSRRLDDIIEFMVREGSAAPQELAASFGVSLMTIHRDLDELQRIGLVRKFYGGVTVGGTTSFEIAATFRRRIAAGLKRDLASRAADLVARGQTIMLDDSTTVACIADRLADMEDLRVWTNYLPLLSTLTANESITVDAIGGRYDPSRESFVGVAAVEAVRRVRVDLALVSTTTADKTGLFHQEEDLVELKAQMLRSAQRRVLVMDSRKIGRVSQFLVDDWGVINDLITDDRAPRDFITDVRAQGVSVHLVHSSEAG